MINFAWPEEYIEFQKSVIDFGEQTLNTDLAKRDADQIFSRDLWKRCADFGIQGLSLPPQYGGAMGKDDFLRSLFAMEGLGYGCRDNGLSFALNAQMWTVQIPILHFGTEEQKETYLPAMCRGELIGAHALTEPEAGSDVFSMHTTAEKVEGGYILNGKKHLITLAPACDVALIFASTNPKYGNWGISAFLVDRDTPGFVINEKDDKMGMRTVPIGSYVFQDCFIAESARLGKEGAGYGIVQHSLEYDRCCILASQLGRMERQLEETLDYVKTRKQFGTSIGSFQSVSNRIVDMKVRLETAKLLLYKTAWMKQNNKNTTMESALLKLHVSESFVASSMDAIRNHGGMSYLSKNGVERDLRDAIGGILYAGTSDIQRNIIAKLLGL